MCNINDMTKIMDIVQHFLLDLSFTNDDVSRNLFENFSPCLESTPKIQKSNRVPKRGTVQRKILTGETFDEFDEF